MPAPQLAYVLGTQGTHTCGDNIVLESEAACQAASAQLGHTYHGQLASTHLPAGCFFYRTSGFYSGLYYNPMATGRTSSLATPVCQLTPPSPPPGPSPYAICGSNPD